MSYRLPIVPSLYGIWVGAFSDSQVPINSSTILAIYDDAYELFNLEYKKLYGAYAAPPATIKNPREWLKEKLAAQEIKVRVNSKISHDLYLGIATHDDTQMWYMQSVSIRHYRRSKNRVTSQQVFFGLDLSLARDESSVGTFAVRAAKHLMADSKVWYGFINPAPRHHVPHPSHYSGELQGRGCWELLVQRIVRLNLTRGPRERVYGVFWGNVFGAELAERIRKAGYREEVDWVREHSFECEPVTLEHESGAMAVLLDDDPEAFARNRDSNLNVDTRSVMTGALMWDVLSRAGLL